MHGQLVMLYYSCRSSTWSCFRRLTQEILRIIDVDCEKPHNIGIYKGLGHHTSVVSFLYSPIYDYGIFNGQLVNLAGQRVVFYLTELANFGHFGLARVLQTLENTGFFKVGQCFWSFGHFLNWPTLIADCI